MPSCLHFIKLYYDFSFLSYCYKSPSTTSIDSSFSSSSVGDGRMVKRPYRMMSNINFEDQQKITGTKRAKKSSITPGRFSVIHISYKIIDQIH